MTDSQTESADAGVFGPDTEESIRELLGDRPLDQPIELLVQLADDGEIDPWDLDLIEVTDAFLDRIDDSDLVVTARTLFYASVLLRLKSDEIVGMADPTAEEPMPPPPAEPGDGDPVAVLEQEMDRRLTRKRARGTPATLADLIRELRAAERERLWKSSRSYDTSGNGHRGPQTLDYRDVAGGEHAGAAVKSVSQTSHHEDLENELKPIIDHLAEAFATDDTVAYDALIEVVAPSPARVYRALVFLEHRGAVELVQRQMYADLTIEPGPRSLEAGLAPREDEPESDPDQSS